MDPFSLITIRTEKLPQTAAAGKPVAGTPAPTVNSGSVFRAGCELTEEQPFKRKHWIDRRWGVYYIS